MSPVITNLLFKSLAETLYMLSVSAIIAAIIGIPLGILLVVTEKNGILVCPVLNKPLAFAINMVRSIPFIILMVAIIPFTDGSRYLHRYYSSYCSSDNCRYSIYGKNGGNFHP